MADPTVVIEVRCDRCNGPWDGEQPALSRTDNKTRICGDCGTEEALEQLSGFLTPRDEWPVPSALIMREARARFASWEQMRGTHGGPMGPPPMPREVPDLRLHLLDRWKPGGTFERIVKLKDLPGPAADHVGHERRALADASLWWVKDEMLALTAATAGAIPKDVTGLEITLPNDQRSGLVVLETPWMAHDAEHTGNKLRVSAFLWTSVSIQGRGCISTSAYEYVDFTEGMDPATLQRAAASGALFDARLEPASGGTMRARGGSWVWLGRSDWPIRDRLDDFSHIEVHFGTPKSDEERTTWIASAIEDRQFFAAFCTLVNNRLTHVESHEAPRQTRRRSERAGIKKENKPGLVRLVRLRQIKTSDDRDPDAEPRRVEWSHRWPVTGYWGWRRCGKGRTQRRLVWIPPCIKGPADKPLVIKSTVRTWVR